MVDTERVSLKSGHAVVDEDVLTVDEQSWSTERWQKIPLEAVTSVEWAKSSSLIVLGLAVWATLGVIGWAIALVFVRPGIAVPALSIVALLAAVLWAAYLWTRSSRVVISAANAEARLDAKNKRELKQFGQAVANHALTE